MSEEPGAMSGWRKALGGWLRLVRLPNLCTVPGDPLFGFLAGGGNLADPRLPWLAGAVLLLYVFGLIDNDLCDLAVDRAERPGRPLPSGCVGLGAARMARWACAMAGLAAAAVAGPAPFAVSVLLLILVAAYNRFKHYPPLGPALIGLCRVFAVAVGLIASPLKVTNPLLLSAVPMIWFFFIYGVGTAAAGEARVGRVRGRGILALTPIIWLAFVLGSTAPDYGVVGLAPGLLLGYAAAGLAVVQGIRAWFMLGGTPAPRQVQQTIGGLVAGMVFLQASGCALAGAPHSGMHAAALAVLLLWLPARWLGRWIPGS
jgi:4-hydroxybenzoate polyprenyltransferase